MQISERPEQLYPKSGNEAALNIFMFIIENIISITRTLAVVCSFAF